MENYISSAPNIITDLIFISMLKKMLLLPIISKYKYICFSGM